MKCKIVDYLFRIIFAMPLVLLGLYLIGDAPFWIYLSLGWGCAMFVDIFRGTLK